MNISTVEELLDFVTNDNGTTSLYDIRLTGDIFNYKIHFEGESWQGLVDVRIADMVKSIQEQFVFMYSLAHNITIVEARTYIKTNIPVELSLENGSTLTEMFGKKLEELFCAIIDGFRKMDEQEKSKFYKMFLIYGFIGFIIYFPVKDVVEKYLDNNHKLEFARMMEEHDMRSSENTLALIDKIQRPNQIIARILDIDDTVTFTNTGETLDKKEATKRFKGTRVLNIETFHADDLYTVTDINSSLESAELFGEIISDDNLAVEVKFDVTSEEYEKLWYSLRSKAPISLMVNVDFKNKKIDKGRVVGLMEPREKARTLKQILDSYLIQ